MNGVLVDTSFLITYSTPSRPNHQTAVAYWQAFVSRGVPMYLSTIVVSEFHVRQNVKWLGLSNFLIVPFNIEHALAAAMLLDPAKTINQDQVRVALKDDVKLLAQCEVQGISHFITDDEPCTKNLKALRAAHSGRPLPHSIYLGDGYDPSWFNPGNQTALV